MTCGAEKEGCASSHILFIFSKWHSQRESQSVCDTVGQRKTEWETFPSGDWQEATVGGALIRPLRAGWHTSDLLLQAHYDLHGLLQDDKLGLGLVALQVDLTHPAQLSEGLVNVAHAHPLPSVVGQSALTLPLLLLLGSEVLIGHWDNAAAGRRGVGGWRGWLTNPNHNPHCTWARRCHLC